MLLFANPFWAAEKEGNGYSAEEGEIAWLSIPVIFISILALWVISPKSYRFKAHRSITPGRCH